MRIEMCGRLQTARIRRDPRKHLQGIPSAHCVFEHASDRQTCSLRPLLQIPDACAARRYDALWHHAVHNAHRTLRMHTGLSSRDSLDMHARGGTVHVHLQHSRRLGTPHEV